MDWTHFSNPQAPFEVVPTEKVAEELSKLNVGKGGRGMVRTIARYWTIAMFEQRDPDRPFALRLQYLGTGGKAQTIDLPWSEVYTKSKGQWRRDSVWRLKPEFVERIAPTVTKAMQVVKQRIEAQ